MDNTFPLENVNRVLTLPPVLRREHGCAVDSLVKLPLFKRQRGIIKPGYCFCCLASNNGYIFLLINLHVHLSQLGKYRYSSLPD